jgi:RNA-directed DNA polymerase
MTNGIKDTKCNSWSDVHWAKANRVINNLQRRIFVAKQQGRFRTLRKLQNLLVSAHSNRLLAVRQVCQIISGKSTPVVDKKVSVAPTHADIGTNGFCSERYGLASSLCSVPLKKWKPMPTKRIYISKPNGFFRSLGNPTLTDRALQAIVKTALEPFWEAVFEASSYGFGNFCSPQDAIRDIHIVCNSQSNKHWIVLGDIKEGAQRVETISHEYLLKQLSSFPAQTLIERWLKAGYVYKHVFVRQEVTL